MKKSLTSIIPVITFITIIHISSCSKVEEAKKEAAPPPPEPANEAIINPSEQRDITFNDIIGKWGLRYGGNYGYDFTFTRNYKSVVILYLNNESLVFKGVFTFDDSGQVRINIVDMKQERKISGINLYHGFVKAKSSYFIFKASLSEKNNRKTLNLQPQNIMIDGNNSDGYFEPLMKLKKI